MKPLLAAVCASAIGVCFAGPERCLESPGRAYDEGVAYHLSRMGVAHRLGAESGVCVAAERWGEVEAAMRNVDRFYWKVSRTLADGCEERAFVEWATREKLRFDVGTAYDLKQRPAGRTFNLRSFTEEEMSANRRKLGEAPADAECKPTGVA